jgi:hypothetical protein
VKALADEERGTAVQELGSGAGVHEWRQVRIAREQRRAAEHEAMARVLAALGTGERCVRVRHRGSSGDWSLECGSSDRARRVLVAGGGVRRGR